MLSYSIIELRVASSATTTCSHLNHTVAHQTHLFNFNHIGFDLLLAQKPSQLSSLAYHLPFGVLKFAIKDLIPLSTDLY